MPTNHPTSPAPAGVLRLVRPLPVVASPAPGRGRADVVELADAVRRHPAGKAVGARPAALLDDAVFVPVLHVPLRDEQPGEVAP